MAVYLARSCPRCWIYFAVVIEEPKSKNSAQPIRGHCAKCGYEIRWALFRVMPQSAIDKIPQGPKLDALTAERIFGWKDVHKHEGALVGKKQDKAGRWRLAKVPYYSTNPVHAYLIEDRMKQLGRLDRYQKELSKITRTKNIPSNWATPDQRCRAAIKAVGRYGQVVPLRKSGGES